MSSAARSNFEKKNILYRDLNIYFWSRIKREAYIFMLAFQLAGDVCTLPLKSPLLYKISFIFIVLDFNLTLNIYLYLILSYISFNFIACAYCNNTTY